jgi:hypothetical protein
MSALRVWTGDRELDLNAFTPTPDRPGTLRLHQRIHVVRTLDERKAGMHNLDQSNDHNAYIKLPVEGGTIDIIYRRGSRTFRHTIFINSPHGK